MLEIAYFALVGLGLGCMGIQYVAIKTRKDPAVGNNPNFKHFQNGYFAAYFPALLADWLQGPYLYKLYSHYGFEEDQIAVLYVCGFASTVILGTWAPTAADKFGRKKLCIFFTLVYSLSCFFKLSRSYGILILGRILGGVATSVLFSAFETWYVQEHLETHDFPKEWIPITFNRASVWNGGLAILAGFVSNIFAEWMSFGPVAPFMMAIPCLVISGLIVCAKWPENYGKQTKSFKKSCGDGLQTIAAEPKIFLIGIIQSMFESSMYIFVFIWTPVLDKANPSLGIIFSCFMICIMIGNAILQLLHQRRVPLLYLLAGSIISALLANIICVAATHPDATNHNLAFIAFLIIEIAVGIYFPAMSQIRNRVVPEAMRASVMNWFRVPLNLIACVVLFMLHSDSFRHGNRLIFIVCSGLLAIASLCTFKFIQMANEEGNIKLDADQDSEENAELYNSSES